MSFRLSKRVFSLKMDFLECKDLKVTKMRFPPWRKLYLSESQVITREIPFVYFA
jgi:hypothetical protein